MEAPVQCVAEQVSDALDAPGAPDGPPGTSALADVLQLGGTPGHLFPALRWFVPPVAPAVGLATTIRVGVSDSGPGTLALRELLDEDLTGRCLVIAGASEVAGALWGEILALAGTNAGLVGVFVDGGVRDLAEIAGIGLPTAGYQSVVAGPAGQIHVLEVGGTVRIGDVDIAQDDHVVLDEAGAVSIGPAAAAIDALSDAGRYVEAEDRAAAALRSGAPLSEAYELKASAVAAIVAEQRRRTAKAAVR